MPEDTESREQKGWTGAVRKSKSPTFFNTVCSMLRAWFQGKPVNIQTHGQVAIRGILSTSKLMDRLSARECTSNFVRNLNLWDEPTPVEAAVMQNAGAIGNLLVVVRN